MYAYIPTVVNFVGQWVKYKLLEHSIPDYSD